MQREWDLLYMGSELKLTWWKWISVQLKGGLLTHLRCFKIEQAPSLISGFLGTGTLCGKVKQSHGGNSPGGTDPQIKPCK